MILESATPRGRLDARLCRARPGSPEGRVARVSLLHTGVSAPEGGICPVADLQLMLLLATGSSCVFQPSPVLWAFRSRNGCRGKEGFGEP
jgi:hypothetical protein